MRKLKLIFFIIFWSSISFAQTIIRGPYLQKRTQTGIQIRFRTDSPVLASIKIGNNLGVYSNEFFEIGSNTEHNIEITGLQPYSKYYYAVFNGTQILEGSADNFFYTTQLAGSEQKIKLWVTGDCGTQTAMQARVKNQFLSYIGSDYMDGWLLLGDNAYSTGLDTEFQNKFFGVYQNDRIMKQTAIYPVPGNHDYYSGSANGSNHNVPYYQIFSEVKNGEMGGVPSGQKEYYSYDIGNVHFIAMDSFGKELGSTAHSLSDTLLPQIVWLKNDLAVNTKKWTILYWHHPPYTMGSHNSDTEADLAAIRTNLIPILERYNVDLVLNGHSHTYERSKLMKGHFGNSLSFSPTQHLVSTSSGKFDGSADSCPYHKKSDGSVKGTIYAVAGSAGWSPSGQANFPHPALPFSEKTIGGSGFLEIEGDRLDFKMISETGTIVDKFTIFKDVNRTQTLNVASGTITYELKSPYKEPSNWVSENLPTNSVILSPPINGTVFHVEDTKGCFKDTLKIETSNPCENIYTITRKIEIGTNIDLKSSEKIILSAQVFENTISVFDASNSLELLPGFESKAGSVFTAKTGGCVSITSP
ncbi:MAG: metallophosphoesterase [Cytophagaceae bacterium]|nr:metallophosphoesterase [Cytophagaceae bacterium]MBL0326351.1 metallophosphoesterase [Cytophagaceae bacterium]